MNETAKKDKSSEPKSLIDDLICTLQECYHNAILLEASIRKFSDTSNLIIHSKKTGYKSLAEFRLVKHVVFVFHTMQNSMQDVAQILQGLIKLGVSVSGQNFADQYNNFTSSLKDGKLPDCSCERCRTLLYDLDQIKIKSLKKDE